jgi:hypothetical protein
LIKSKTGPAYVYSQPTDFTGLPRKNGCVERLTYMLQRERLDCVLIICARQLRPCCITRCAEIIFESDEWDPYTKSIDQPIDLTT